MSDPATVLLLAEKPLSELLAIAAHQLAAKIETGTYAALPQSERFELRALAEMQLLASDLALDLEEQVAGRTPRRRRMTPIATLVKQIVDGVSTRRKA